MEDRSQSSTRPNGKSGGGGGATPRQHLHQDPHAHGSRPRCPQPAPRTAPAPRAPQVREGRGPRAGASRRRRRRPGRGDPRAPEEAPRPSPGPSGPPKLAPRFPELQERPDPKEVAKGTHRDHDRVFSLKLDDVLVAAVHLGLVQRSEATHHFDVALGRVRHLPGCRGRRPGATPRRLVLKETGRAEGLGSRRQRARGPRRRASPAERPGPGLQRPRRHRRPQAHFRPIMAAMAAAAAPGGGGSSASPSPAGQAAGLGDPGDREHDLLFPPRREQAALTVGPPCCPLAGSPATAFSFQRPQTGDGRWEGRRGAGGALRTRGGPGNPATNPRPRRRSEPGSQGQVSRRARAERPVDPGGGFAGVG